MNTINSVTVTGGSRASNISLAKHPRLSVPARTITTSVGSSCNPNQARDSPEATGHLNNANDDDDDISSSVSVNE
jgi:hypothetical protein